ncbi:MAG: bifunctional 5,10-methylenetetrahydrofolate dehydrogenase/5,10-methenyltetrahydrofolate cyclohydrolase [Patescibacteria group bacterium]
MIIFGKEIAERIKNDLVRRVAEASAPVSFGIVTAGTQVVTEKYLAMKKKFGTDIGVTVDIRAGNTESTDAFVQTVLETVSAHKAVIVQLPLPTALNREKILLCVPKEADVDVLSLEACAAFASGESPFIPPVLSAIQKVLGEGKITLLGKKIVIVGKGQLVGTPVSEWLTRERMAHDIITKDTSEEEKGMLLRSADVIISGAGVPHMITPDMVKDGVVLIDAGTTEDSGVLVGDVDPLCAEKAALFTPVPGGIGPITVATLYENVLRAHGI